MKPRLTRSMQGRLHWRKTAPSASLVTQEFNLCCAEAEGALLGQFRHLHHDIYGNRGEII
jgi:hypothetical protein